MSAWPEAIYTIKKITADILEKYGLLSTSMSTLQASVNTTIGDIGILQTSVNTAIGDIGTLQTSVTSIYNVDLSTRFTSVDTALGSLNTAIASLSTHIDAKFDLTDHIVTNNLSNLDTSSFSPGAIAFIGT